MAVKNNDSFIKNIQEYLDQSADALDSETLSRIGKARIEALEQRHPGLMLWLVSTGGIAAAAVVLLIAFNLLTGPDYKQASQPAGVAETSQGKPGTGNGDIEIQPYELALVEILSDEQQFDLFENIDFYTWVAESENTAG